MSYGFPYKSAQELKDDLIKNSISLPWSDDLSVLGVEVAGKNFSLKNAMVVQPMEGCDGTIDGTPTDWTLRRYERFATGGSGLLWVEAVAVRHEGRANPHQLMITKNNLGEFKRLVDITQDAAIKGTGKKTVTIVQLTHSGRFSRPTSGNEPIRSWTSPVLDAHQKLPDDYPIVTDEHLDSLVEDYANATHLCMEAGFDGVDVKACHLYLLSELLGGYDRTGKYGGAYENRVRMLHGCIDAAKTAGGTNMILSARINVYDGSAGNWGVGENLSFSADEPLRLVKEMDEHGVSLINVTMGTPYFNPHVNRPYAAGGYQPPEPPIVGVSRLLNGCAKMQSAVPNVVCVATGFSYLRHYAPQVAAGLLASGGAKAVGFGRQSFAYPDYANDILNDGKMHSIKSCLTCGICTKIMRAGGRPGCPVRDAAFYVPEYRRVVK